MTWLEVLACGPLASLQDGGRPGLARLGLPRSGALDPRALHIANALVGNAPDEAVIEMAWMGMKVGARGGPIRLAVTGAPTRITGEGGVPLDHHSAFTLNDGEVATIGRAERGVFMVLAAAGGFDVAPVLASRSYYARGALGGFQGRALAAGDRIPLRPSGKPAMPLLSAEPIEMEDAPTLRVMVGPEAEHFVPEALATLLGSPFRVTEQSDRMAYRLAGAPLERRTAADLTSTGTMPGAIQVPPDGQPLVLMADCQTIGGYPRLAHVVSVDLPKLAQCRPGSIARFALVDLEEAQRAARQTRATQIRLRMAPVRQAGGACPAGFDLDARLALHCADHAVHALDAASWEWRDKAPV